MLWLLLLLVGLVLYSSGAFNSLGGQLDTHKHANAMDLLDERYARSELSTNEYDTMKKSDPSGTSIISGTANKIVKISTTLLNMG
jgi:hypothetical protein